MSVAQAGENQEEKEQACGAAAATCIWSAATCICSAVRAALLRPAFGLLLQAGYTVPD